MRVHSRSSRCVQQVGGISDLRASQGEPAAKRLEYQRNQPTNRSRSQGSWTRRPVHRAKLVSVAVCDLVALRGKHRPSRMTSSALWGPGSGTGRCRGFCGCRKVLLGLRTSSGRPGIFLRFGMWRQSQCPEVCLGSIPLPFS